MKKVLAAILIVFLAVSFTYAADTKVSALPELAAAPAESDELYINDGGTSKKITVTNLLKALESALTSFAIHQDNLPATISGITLNIGAGDVSLIGTTSTGTIQRTSAVGTPMFTAINMPSANADPGTTAGQISHDSTDTGSNSGGTYKWYDGANVRSIVDTGTNYTIITKTEFLPIAWAVDGATAPSALAAVTGKEINARSFTEADDVVFWWIVPIDYVGGIKYRVLYALSANANTDDTAVFSMAGSIVANSGDLDGSAGTVLTISDELTTDDDQYQVMMTDFSAESNADWSLAASGLARLNFSHAAASDMAGAGEPLVIGIEIKYKAKIIGFAGY